MLPCYWIETLCLRVCRATQCSPLIIYSLRRFQRVLLTSAYIIQYHRSKPLNYEKRLPQRKVLYEQARRQHALTRVDCEDPFIAACNFDVLFFFFFSGPNDCIFYCRNILQNSPNLKCTLHLPKNVIICCHPQFPSLGDGIIKESAFLLIAPILLRTFKYHIHAFSELYWIWWYSPRPFQQISANSQNIAKLLFRTPRRQFHWYERNFPHSKMHH